jgi:hypothetical protein
MHFSPPRAGIGRHMPTAVDTAGTCPARHAAISRTQPDDRAAAGRASTLAEHEIAILAAEIVQCASGDAPLDDDDDTLAVAAARLRTMPAAEIAAAVAPCLIDSLAAQNFLIAAQAAQVGAAECASGIGTAQRLATGGAMWRNAPSVDAPSDQGGATWRNSSIDSYLLLTGDTLSKNAPQRATEGACGPFVPNRAAPPEEEGQTSDQVGATSPQADATSAQVALPSAQVGATSDPSSPRCRPASSGQANDAPVPIANELVYATIQIWYNADPTPQRSRWMMKLRTAHADDFAGDDAALRETFVAFAAGRRRLRQNLMRQTDQPAILDRYDAWASSALSPTSGHQWVGVVAARIARDPYQRRGRKTVQPFAGYYAVLHLDDAGQTPVQVDLYLDDAVPLSITGFHAPTTTRRGAARKATAAGWIGYYDPGGLWHGVSQDIQALRAHQRQQQALRDFHPRSALVDLVRQYVMPLDQAVALFRQRLEDTQTQTRSAEIAELRVIVNETLKIVAEQGDTLRALSQTRSADIADLHVVVNETLKIVAEQGDSIREQARQLRDLRAICAAPDERLGPPRSVG